MIGYNVSADGKWCLAIGIFQASPGVIAGTMQLYRCVLRTFVVHIFGVSEIVHVYVQ